MIQKFRTNYFMPIIACLPYIFLQTHRFRCSQQLDFAELGFLKQG
jgi:hypothetical protein